MCVTSHQEICARFRLTSNFIFFFKSVNYAAGRATEMWRVVGKIKLIQLSPWVWIQPTLCDARKNMFFFPFPYSFMSHCKNPSSSGCWWRARGWGCCPRCWTTSLKHGLYLYPTPPSSHTGEFFRKCSCGIIFTRATKHPRYWKASAASPFNFLTHNSQPEVFKGLCEDYL